MSPKPKLSVHPSSVPGDFYVTNGCCTSCGLPETLAPDLIGGVAANGDHCYWKKQPTTPDEIERAIDVVTSQELGCHRYAGREPEILKRLAPEDCDHFAQPSKRKGSVFRALKRLL
jgi:hypothetical protein